MTMPIARLDDLPFLLGELCGGADIIGNDFDPFTALYNLSAHDLREAIIRECVIPQMTGSSDEERNNLKTTLTYLIQNPVADEMIDSTFASCLLPVEVPPLYYVFLLAVFEAVFPGQDPFKLPCATTFLA